MYLTEFLTVALIHLLAVASPGPDFAVVVRESVTHGRRAGTWTALGVGSAIFLHVGYSLLGIGLIVSQSIVLFNALKWAAAAYLLYIGFKALRAQPAKPASEEDLHREVGERTARGAFTSGFVTNGLNPLLNERVRVLDQLFAVGGREHRQPPAQQLFAQRREIGLQVPLHRFKQPAGLPLLTQLLGHANGLLTVRAAHQHQHFAVQRLLHALFGAQLQRVRGVTGHQCHEVGRQRRAMAPLPARHSKHGQQQNQKAPWQPAFTAQSRAAPLHSTVDR